MNLIEPQTCFEKLDDIELFKTSLRFYFVRDLRVDPLVLRTYRSGNTNGSTLQEHLTLNASSTQGHNRASRVAGSTIMRDLSRALRGSNPASNSHGS